MFVNKHMLVSADEIYAWIPIGLPLTAEATIMRPQRSNLFSKNIFTSHTIYKKNYTLGTVINVINTEVGWYSCSFYNMFVVFTDLA